MTCSCRITPLRTFVQGLSQVHKAEGPAPSVLLRLPLRSQRQQLLVARHARPFHASRYLKDQDATNEAPALPSNVQINTVAPSSDAAPGFRQDATAGVGAVEMAAAASSSSSSSGAAADKPRRPRKPRASAPFPKPADRFRGRPPKPGGKFGTDAAAKGGRGFAAKPFGRPSKFDAAPKERKPFVRLSPTDPDPEQPDKPIWRTQKEALKEKFPDGWKPVKRLSPDALAGIRALNAQFPDVYTTPALAQKFEVSVENIRRILRSKWQPSVDEEQSRQERWHRRGVQVWERKAALGIKPPRKWRDEGVARDPGYHEWRQGAVQRNRAFEERQKAEYQAKPRERP